MRTPVPVWSLREGDVLLCLWLGSTIDSAIDSETLLEESEPLRDGLLGFGGERVGDSLIIECFAVLVGLSETVDATPARLRAACILIIASWIA